MSRRREFTLTIDKEIRARARDANGELRCENLKCGAVVRRGEVHHLREDALEVDKSQKLTAKDGQFLCIHCHKEVTKTFAPIIAKVRRVEAKHVGATRPAGKLRSASFPRKSRPHEGRAPVAGSPAFMRQIVTTD